MDAGADEDVGWSLGVLLRAYQEEVGTLVGEIPHGPRGYLTLSTVAEGDQPSQLALASRLGIDRSVMTYVIDDLVAAGLVERQLNPDDRRQRRIVATRHGNDALVELRRRVRQAEECLLGALGADDRALFRTLLRRAARGVRDGASMLDATVAEEPLPSA